MNPKKESQPNKKVQLIVQARMESTRLPGKVMRQVLGRPLLSFLLERLMRVQLADKIVVAVPDNDYQRVILECCKQHGIDHFPGSHEDVLDRYFQAATAFSGDVIVRITSDCPLIDPEIIDVAITRFIELQPECDYLSNTLIRTYPRGMDVEVFSFNSLKLAAYGAKNPEEREHVTPFIYRNPEIFKLHSFVHTSDDSRYRWTVDTDEDLALITKILEALYSNKPDFTLADLLQLLERYPEWSSINAHIAQK